MHRSGALALIAAVGLTAAATSAQAATTFLSVGPDSLCGASGCFAGSKKTFTQTFSAAGQGGGSVDISSLSLFRSVVGEMGSYAVKVTIQLADGTEVSWGKFTVAAMNGEKVVTIGGEKVNWDTALGDLKVRLDLVVPEKGGIGGGGFAGGGGGGGLAAPELPFSDIVTSGPLVRPSLPLQPVVAIPEPGAWALMIMGFGAAGSILRRRKALAT